MFCTARGLFFMRRMKQGGPPKRPNELLLAHKYEHRLNLQTIHASNKQKHKVMTQEDNLIRQFGQKRPFKVPEGYFEELDKTIMSKVGQHKQRPQAWWKGRRQLAIAASITALLMMGAGYGLVRYTHPYHSQQAYEVSHASMQEDNLDSAADYMMLDKEDMYAYISEH